MLGVVPEEVEVAVQVDADAEGLTWDCAFRVAVLAPEVAVGLIPFYPVDVG